LTQGEKVNNEGEKVLVEIRITNTSSYCGGIPPPEEVRIEHNTPKPFAKKIIFIKKGEQNTFDSKIFLELVSDSAGKIEIQLPPGKYFIVDELKKDTSFFNRMIKKYEKESKNCSAINKDCLRKWYEQPDFVFEIKEESTKLVVNFHDSCSWNEVPYNCCQYKGPYPP
jgi:hypothetical protein